MKNDLLIQRDVIAALALDSALSADAIGVEAHHGFVKLAGHDYFDHRILIVSSPESSGGGRLAQDNSDRHSFDADAWRGNGRALELPR